MDNKMEVIDVVGKFLKMMAPFSNNLLILWGNENISEITYSSIGLTVHVIWFTLHVSNMFLENILLSC